MKQDRILRAIAAASVVALMASPVMARGGSGGAGMGAGAGMGGLGGQPSAHISTQGSLNTNGPNATDRDFGRDRASDRANANADLDTKTTDTKTGTKMAGRSKSHVSASGQANTNGLNATDRDKGTDRAEDRPAP